MTKKVKIVIADDHELIRKGYISFLSEDPKISVIGEAENGNRLIELLKIKIPDIILLDLEMPVMNGEEALNIISKRFPEIKVIILSMHFGDALISYYMSKGARAFLSKNCNIETVFDAIHSVNTLGHYFSNSTSKALLNGMVKGQQSHSFTDKYTLTDRETEIVKQLCLGKTNKEIGSCLSISARTVDFHRRNIYEKTKCKNSCDLAVYAVKNAIIQI